MGVASHLGIELTEYDARIRTFIPDYEEMLDVASAAMPRGARTIVDLGTGTGALAARCLERAPRANVIGIDADPDMLTMAARRLGDRATLTTGSFLRTPIPRCDAVVSSFALHHIRTRPAKRALYRTIRRSLRRRGRLVIVECQPAARAAVASVQFGAWNAHLRRTYSAREARGLMNAWAKEDVYVPLDAELGLLRAARFNVELLWRKGAFAVLLAS